MFPIYFVPTAFRPAIGPCAVERAMLAALGGRDKADDEAIQHPRVLRTPDSHLHVR